MREAFASPPATPPATPADDPIGAEWERVTRAAWAINYDWTPKEIAHLNVLQSEIQSLTERIRAQQEVIDTLESLAYGGRLKHFWTPTNPQRFVVRVRPIEADREEEIHEFATLREAAVWDIDDRRVSTEGAR